MAALRINILSNYVGQIWMAAMGIAFLPLYMRTLGMEAFGLIGLMLTLQSISQVFDFGIGGSTNRELSRRIHQPSLANNTNNLVRTSEILIWALALAIALLVWLASNPMAFHWLHISSLDRQEASSAIALMGVAIALMWPSSFYSNCLAGLEQQPILNVLNIIFATLRYAGVLPILLWISPTISAFLWWHALVGASQSLIMAWAVWRILPSRKPAYWSLSEIKNNRTFAGGLFAISLLALSVTQLDRLALASLLPLEELGYYTLALSISAGLGRMVQPMFTALYPRFSRLVAFNDETTLRKLYHLSSQYLAVVIAATAAVLIFFSYDVLLLWTGSTIVADKTALPLSLLVLGSALNGLINIPYALQLASGWTQLALTLNTASLLLGIPLCLWAVPHYGMTGAALLWLMTNLVSFTIGIPLMHRRLLHGEMRHWYLRDNLPPILAASTAALVLQAALPPLSRSMTGVALLAFASAVVLAVTAMASRNVRELIWGQLRTSP